MSTRRKAGNHLKAVLILHLYVRYRCEGLYAASHPVAFETHTVTARGSYLSGTRETQRPVATVTDINEKACNSV